MSEELKSALARITCLEGEIAKRDAVIVGLTNSRDFWREKAIAADDELAALKAQEPVAWVGAIEDGVPLLVAEPENWKATPLYVAPVSEAKAQGEYGDAYQGAREDLTIWKRRALEAEKALQEERIITERLGNALNEENGPTFMGEPVFPAKAQGVVMQSTDGGRNPRYEGLFDGETEEQRASRLNATPVQQVSVPDVSAMARILADRNADACNVNREDNWAIYGQDYIDDVTAMLAAAPAAPAADGWISVSERLPEVLEGDEQEVIVSVKRAHDGKSYSFSARYLNSFPLHSDYEDEPMVVTGWHDVKEHAEYDGWYSPLIDSSSGDEVTHWMPLPAAHRAKGVV